MISFWTYPWTVMMEGPDDACQRMADAGVGSASVATQYHSVSSINPRFPDTLITDYRSGCYLDPTTTAFANAPLEPPLDDLGGENPLGEIVTAGDRSGLPITAWIVCLHNSQLAANNPAYRIQSALGDERSHAVCPSHPDVREYVAAIVEEVCAQGVNAVQLESIGYQSVFHHHWTYGGHQKRQVLNTRTDEILFSQCFCSACREGARDDGVDVDDAHSRIEGYLRDRLASPHEAEIPIDEFLERNPSIADLFDYRARTVTDLVRGAAEATDGQSLSYIMLSEAARPGSGVRIGTVDRHLDSILKVCYVDNPTSATRRLKDVQSETASTIDAGVRIDPDSFDEPSEFEEVVRAIQAQIAGDIYVYNHSLLAERQLEWVAQLT